MEENEIRPAEMFDEYLRLSAEDVERFFPLMHLHMSTHLDLLEIETMRVSRGTGHSTHNKPGFDPMRLK